MLLASLLEILNKYYLLKPHNKLIIIEINKISIKIKKNRENEHF